ALLARHARGARRRQRNQIFDELAWDTARGGELRPGGVDRCPEQERRLALVRQEGQRLQGRSSLLAERFPHASDERRERRETGGDRRLGLERAEPLSLRERRAGPCFDLREPP